MPASGTGAPYLLFAGHTLWCRFGDAANWRFDPFSAEIADGAIYGRGGRRYERRGVAAFAAAACAFVARHGTDKGSIGFLITGDEEGPAINGTAKLLRWAHERGERFDHCILGEPTNPEALGDMIKIGRRGSLNGTLIAQGRQGHVAYPQRAINPIPQLMRLLDAVSRAARFWNRPFRRFEPRGCERSMSATRRSMSFRRKRAQNSTSGSMISGRPMRSRPELHARLDAAGQGLDL